MSNPKKNDEYWMDVIQTCRTSGLSDLQWCRENGINTSTFYYHVKCLREKACTIPVSIKNAVREKQEVVQIFSSGATAGGELFPEICPSAPCHSSEPSQTDSTTAIRIDFRGIHLEITNTACHSAIADTLNVLLGLC